MGRGDIRTKKGKICAGTYGKSRPHKEKNRTEVVKKASKK